MANMKTMSFDAVIVGGGGSGMRAALQLAGKGSPDAGGSTLSMQLARLIEPRESRSLSSKLRQLLRAIQIERRLSKRDILERYLTLAPYGGNLERLGIELSFRLVDPAQYQSRMNVFDFDMTGQRYSLSPTPGEAVRQFWTSEAARTDGSYNLAGIADPAVDVLVEALINAPTRADMVTAARALDRVLRSGFYWVPNWFKPVHTVAYWDEFGFPEAPPHYGFPAVETWWHAGAATAKKNG